MKEFDKWLNYVGVEWSYESEDAAEMAWETALKWALTQTVERRVLELNGTIIHCTDILPRAIEEELET